MLRKLASYTKEEAKADPLRALMLMRLQADHTGVSPTSKEESLLALLLHCKALDWFLSMLSTN